MAKKTLEFELKSDIGKVTKQTEKLTEELGEAKENTSGLGSGLAAAGNSGKKGFKMITGAVKSFGLALKAAGVGIIIAGFLALKEALGRNQKIMDEINTVVTTISYTFNSLVDVLVDTYNWVASASDNFDALGKVLSGIMTLALNPLKASFYAVKLGVLELMVAWEDSFLGSGDTDTIAQLNSDISDTKTVLGELTDEFIEAGKSVYNNFGEALTEAGEIATRVFDGAKKISVESLYAQAKATTELQKQSLLAVAALKGLVEQNDFLAESQRQVRDDVSKTFKERIDANNELGKILAQQRLDMLEMAEITVRAAKQDLDNNKENIEFQVAYKEALNERAAVEAQVNGFKSEQLVNQVALEKELLDATNELSLAGKTNLDRELQELENNYKLKLDMARKAGADTAAIEAEFRKDKRTATLTAVSGEMEAYGALADSLSKLAGDNKLLASAGVVINTSAGVMKSFAQGGILGGIGAAVVIANGVKALKDINSTKIKGSSGGAGGQISASLAAEAAPPAKKLSGDFSLNGNSQAPTAIKAYVVTDEMTDSQNQLSNIRERATI